MERFDDISAIFLYSQASTALDGGLDRRRNDAECQMTWVDANVSSGSSDSKDQRIILELTCC